MRDVSKSINLIPGEQVDNTECHIERHFVFTEEHCVSSKRTPEQDTGIVTLTRSPAFRECMKSFLGKEMATHSSILAWKIPCTEKPAGLVHGVARVGHDLAAKQQQKSFLSCKCAALLPCSQSPLLGKSASRVPCVPCMFLIHCSLSLRNLNVLRTNINTSALLTNEN